MSLPASIITVGKADATCTVVCGDSREELRACVGQADLIITSPPYADARHRHYDSVHPDEFADWFMTFHEPFWNALKPSGSLVINIKDKVVGGVRHRYVWHTIEALSRAGWLCIEDYLWHKTNPMPGYWPTRLRDGWEYCFHLSRSKRPYMNQAAVRKPVGDWVESRLAKLGDNDKSRQNSANASGFGRDISKWVNKQTVLPSNVLSLPLVGKNKGHPAVFPIDLPLFFIRLLCPEGGLVIDPFGGSGTTGLAALAAGRRSLLIDNNEQYCRAAVKRLREEGVARRHELLTEQTLFPVEPPRRGRRRNNS
ncbi:MAG: site-specific DNA-methyltransferase [Acidobacteria bacterium]|nr:site-specific DNA-methyltransferase [Acidobacteriota bacterium]MCA1620390.1 site-specific DNA-methyltransferase [Acidobacteriota bacterium]